MNHTAKRLIKSLKTEDLMTFNGNELILESKYRMDGSAGQQNYKQKYNIDGSAEPSTSSVHNDSSVFIICVSPLQLATVDNKDVLWYNKKPSSTRLVV